MNGRIAFCYGSMASSCCSAHCKRWWSCHRGRKSFKKYFLAVTITDTSLQRKSHITTVLQGKVQGTIPNTLVLFYYLHYLYNVYMSCVRDINIDHMLLLPFLLLIFIKLKLLYSVMLLMTFEYLFNFKQVRVLYCGGSRGWTYNIEISTLTYDMWNSIASPKSRT